MPVSNASSSPFIPGTSVGNMQGVSSGSGTSLIRMPDGSVRRVPVNNIPDNATPLSIDGQKVEVKGASPELVEHKGRMVAKDRITGLWRPGAGMVDWITGNRTDWDKQGDGTGVAHPVTGAGEVAPGFEKDVTGEIVKKPKEEKSWLDKYLEETLSPEFRKEEEARANRMADKKMWREIIGKNLGNLGSTLAAGQWAVAEANRGIAEQATRAGAHLPDMAAAVQPYQPRGRTSYYGGGSQKKALGS